MNTKLTLTIDKSVIEKAKTYAEEQGRSLSAVVENYLKAITRKQEYVVNEEALSPIVKSLRGAFKMPTDLIIRKSQIKSEERDTKNILIMKISKVLIDSDIILDYFLDRKPFSDDLQKF